jgi:hypothetical protein
MLVEEKYLVCIRLLFYVKDDSQFQNHSNEYFIQICWTYKIPGAKI